MKSSKIIIALFVSILISFSLNAQLSFSDNSSLLTVNDSDVSEVFVSFSSTKQDEQVYLNWTVNGITDDCVFAIQRSEDGINYETIGYKSCVGTDANINLLYCFIDESPSSEKMYYRITIPGNDQLVSSDFSIIDSEEINIPLNLAVKE